MTSIILACVSVCCIWFHFLLFLMLRLGKINRWWSIQVLSMTLFLFKDLLSPEKLQKNYNCQKSVRFLQTWPRSDVMITIISGTNRKPDAGVAGVRGVLVIRGMMSLRWRSSIASASDWTSKPFILSGLNTCAWKQHISFHEWFHCCISRPRNCFVIGRRQKAISSKSRQYALFRCSRQHDSERQNFTQNDPRGEFSKILKTSPVTTITKVDQQLLHSADQILKSRDPPIISRYSVLAD